MKSEISPTGPDWTVDIASAANIVVCVSPDDAEYIRANLPSAELEPTAVVHGTPSSLRTEADPDAAIILVTNGTDGTEFATWLGRPIFCLSGNVQEMGPHELAEALGKAHQITPEPSKTAQTTLLQQAPPVVAPAPGEAATIVTLNGKPALELNGIGRPLGEFADECGKLLAGCEIFVRKGRAFMVNIAEQILEVATPVWLRSWAEKHVCCFKMRAGNGRELRLASTMTDDAARVVLEAPQFLAHLRPIERFHPCPLPIIRRDGTLELLPEGYDAESAIYTAPGASYPLDISFDDARSIIDEAYAEFPFTADDGQSKAVAISALMTIFAGGIMPKGSNRPVFLYLANAEGSGKTTAARLAGIAFGAIPVEPCPQTEEEWSKKLLSAVISGRRVMLLDNLKGFLNSASLEAYTSASSFNGRILGESKEFSGDACATVLITGNQLTISPDMRRRALVVNLFMHELRAEDRKFARLLDDPELLLLRPRLLAACWAFVRHWNSDGRPGSSRQNSSFPRWCDTIGAIVEHAAYACPTAPAEIEGMGDTDTADIGKLADAMVSGERYTFGELVDLCSERGLFERFTVDRDKDGELSRSAKSGFPKALKKYDRRFIARGMKFYVEGNGRDRRYVTK